MGHAGKARLRALLAALLAALMLLAAPAALADIVVIAQDYPVEEDGWYDSMEEVAVYLATYDELPGNYLTKKAAQALGWSSSQGNLWDVADGMSIGGDRFGNYEGLLPDAKGRSWTECDIDFDGGYRGAERIIFSNDGLIYYTQDHYASFEQITVDFERYGENDYDEEVYDGDGEDGDLFDLIRWFLR